MNFDVMIDSLPRLLQGAVTTIELIALALVIGAALAVPMALLRVSSSPWVRALPLSYIFFFRGTPLMVQIFLIYYGAAQFDVVRDSMLWPILREPYWCAIIAFSLNSGAYTAEILRGAIQSVPHGEVEAARAMGMTTATAYRRIIVPRALRIGLPAFGNEVILMLKNSALASTITLLDLTGMAKTIIARTFMPVEIYLTAGIIYLLMTTVFIYVFTKIEKRVTGHLQPR